MLTMYTFKCVWLGEQVKIVRTNNFESAHKAKSATGYDIRKYKRESEIPTLKQTRYK